MTRSVRLIYKHYTGSEPGEKNMKCQAQGLCRNEADPTLVAYEEECRVVEQRVGRPNYNKPQPVQFPCCRECWEPGWDVPPEPPPEDEFDGGYDGY